MKLQDIREKSVDELNTLVVDMKKELFNLKGKMTIIIVSHRLCTIKDCDEIVVINEGKIVEKGKHEELIACRGIYHSLMEKQIDNE